MESALTPFEKPPVPPPPKAERPKDSPSIDELEKRVSSGEVDVLDIADLPPETHSRLLLKAIEAGRGFKVVISLYLFETLDASVAEKMLEIGAGEQVAYHVDRFPNLDRNAFAEKLFKESRARPALAANLEKFPGLDQAALAEALMQDGEGHLIAKHLQKFHGLDHEKIAVRLVESGLAAAVCMFLKNFTEADHNVIAEAILQSRQPGDLYIFLSHLIDFHRLNSRIASGLIEAGEARAVTLALLSFEGLDNDVALKLIAAEYPKVVAARLDRFNNLGSDVASALLEKGGLSGLICEHIGSFDASARKQIADLVIQNGQSQYVARHIEKFPRLEAETYRVLVSESLHSNELANALKVNRLSPTPEHALERAANDFGDALTGGLAETYRAVYDGQISDELKQLRVRHSGEAGLNELLRAYRSHRHALIAGTVDPERILESTILTQWTQAAVRYEDSEWGEHDDESFRATVEYYAAHQQELAPLPKGYEPSPVLHIAKIDQEKQAEFMHSEGFLSRYRTLLASVQEARALADDPQALNILRDRLKQKHDKALAALDAQIAKAQEKKPQAVSYLQEQKAELERVSFDVFEKPQAAFNTLASFRELFNEELRVLMLYAAYRFNPSHKREEVSQWDPAHPTLDQLSWTLNFIDHVANQETMVKYFTNKEAAKRFKGIMSVSALEQELVRWQNQATAGTAEIRFVPNRNLLTEFSGHFSDACWASKYRSVLADWPNFIGLAMVQNPDDPKDESLAGGAFLIEADGQDNQKLLIIRGLNPRENVVNQLSPKDFMDKLTGYLKPMAGKLGRKLAIVIDDHAGGAGTNRPVLFAYLHELAETLAKAEIGDFPEDQLDPTEFNGYDIRQDTYLL